MQPPNLILSSPLLGGSHTGGQSLSSCTCPVCPSERSEVQEHNAHKHLSELPQRLGSLCCKVFGWSLPSRQLKVHKLRVPTRLGAPCCLFIKALIPT